jgi:hypothetical protein
VLGDCVNLSARLMANAPALGVLCDEETCKHGTGEVLFKSLAPIKVKGKANPIPIFKPTPRESAYQIGLTLERKIRFPWYDNPMDGSNITAKDVVNSNKSKVIDFCSISKSSTMIKVTEMLGSPFNKALHSLEQSVGSYVSATKPPANSPFAGGGILVLEGETGLGKIEAAEHIVTHCAMQFQMLPVFGTMGPRPGESLRICVELLRSIVAVFRHLNASVPSDDVQALVQVVPLEHASQVPALRDLLASRSTAANQSELFELGSKVVCSLLQILKKQTPVLVTLQFEHGSSLFEKTTATDQALFWKLAEQIGLIALQEKKISCMILCREAKKSKECVKSATVLTLKGLSEDNILDYMANYLKIPEQAVPPPLRRFVCQVTMGNALYIRETLDQLVEDQHLKVKAGVSAALGVGVLDRIDIASWSHTSMVGGTICEIESLEPIEAAALKMSTCFEGPFSLADLAASSSSAWGGSTHFDLLRLFRATQKLISRGFIERVKTPERDSQPAELSDEEGTNFGETQYFQMQSALVRTVGAAMVLEAQKKSVKRNALIDRVLKKDLPERMSALQAKKAVQHIPWYYERALRRMLL